MYPIIAAVRCNEELELALESSVETVFLLKSDIMDLESVISKSHEAGKKIFVHMDFADGVGKDSSGCVFLKNAGADGIISTRTGIIKTARDKGIETVQRVFIVDSHSIETAVDTMQKNIPSMIELMPGIATKAVSHFSMRVNIPIIAGGLIETEEEVELAIRAGASAVSTGKSWLWK